MNKREQYERFVESFLDKAMERLEKVMIFELKRIQKKHFYRHSIYFLDAMGQTSIEIGENILIDTSIFRKDKGYNNQERMDNLFRPLTDLIIWYNDQVDRLKISINEIRI